MAAHLYVTTAQPPTAVTHCISCCFAPGKKWNAARDSPPQNLIVAKGTRLEVYLVVVDDDAINDDEAMINGLIGADSTISGRRGSGGGDGDSNATGGGYLAPQRRLQMLVDSPVFGTIAVLRAFRAPGEQFDRIFMATDKFEYAVLSYRYGEDPGIYTVCSGNVRDPIAQPTDYGAIGIADPEGRCVSMHVYDGMLRVLPGEFLTDSFAAMRGDSNRYGMGVRKLPV